LLDSIKLENALVLIQFKHNFYIMDEKNSRVDLTIQDCASGDYDGKCIDVTIEGRETN